MPIILPTRHLLYFLLIAYEVYIMMASILISYYSYRAFRVLRSSNMLLMSLGILLFGIYMLVDSVINISILVYFYYEPARRALIVPPSMNTWFIVDEIVELVSLVLIALSLTIRIEPSLDIMPVLAAATLTLTPGLIIHTMLLVNILILSYICVLLWLRFSQGNRLVILTAIAFTLLLFNTPIELIVYVLTRSMFIVMSEERLVYSIISTILLINVIRVVRYGKT